MILKRIKVTNFRSVEDSGWIEIDKVTALIGVNESGKSNLLLPLWKFNPAREGKLQPTSDYPKKLFGDIRAEPARYAFIEVELDAGDLATQIASKSGLDAEDVRKVRVSKNYADAYEVTFPDAKPTTEVSAAEIGDIMRKAAATLGSASPLKSEEAVVEPLVAMINDEVAKLPSEPMSVTSVVELTDRLHEASPKETAKSRIAPIYATLTEDLSAIVTRMQRPPAGQNAEVRDLVIAALPKFVYYSNYGNLDSEIYLPHVVENLAREDLGAKEAAKARTLRVLFKFVKLQPKEILDLGKDTEAGKNGRPTDEDIDAAAERKRERSILLQSAGTKLTTRFRDWWKQGDYRFRFEADGDHFRIWVADERRPEEVELESRSTGLQWFLSFYLVFLVESEEAHDRAVLLLDEPGLSLHPLAQRDLSAFFDNLAETNQLIYTTHSPFLVDADRLDRARKVYVSSDGTTKVTENLRDGTTGDGQRGAAYAVHSALNISIAESLLLGCRPVLVEGATDQHYLTAIKALLIREGRIKPKRELVFPPSGGAKMAKTIASIVTGRDEDLPFVLLDGDSVGTSARKDLQKELYAEKPERVLSAADYAQIADGEVEDLVPQDFMVALIDRLFRQQEIENEFVNFAKPGALVPQIKKWAADTSLKLPDDYKVQLAKFAKTQMLAKNLDSFGEQTIANWVRLFEAFEGGA